MVITVSFELTISLGVTQVTGPTGAIAFELDGRSQFVNFGDRLTECLGNTELCKTGMTVSFNIKFLSELVDNTYIFTNGGDLPGSYGMAMWYDKKQIFLAISTSTQIWTVATTRVKIMEYFKCEFSWSKQGLYLYFNDELVAQETQFITRVRAAVASNFLFIGKSFDSTIFCNMIFEGWNVVYSTKETAKSLEIDFGMDKVIFIITDRYELMKYVICSIHLFKEYILIKMLFSCNKHFTFIQKEKIIDFSCSITITNTKMFNSCANLELSKNGNLYILCEWLDFCLCKKIYMSYIDLFHKCLISSFRTSSF